MVIATDGEGTKDYIIENSTVMVVTISHRRLRGLFFVNCMGLLSLFYFCCTKNIQPKIHFSILLT